jgi:integrase
VLIVAALRAPLAAHLLRSRRRSGLVFGRQRRFRSPRADSPFRSERAWKAAGLEPITLHELRHTCASIFIAAGVNAKALSTFLGHSGIAITLDRYGHLFPGSGDEAVALVDAYLERTTGAFSGAEGPKCAPLRQT